jgi:hypothetical protein
MIIMLIFFINYYIHEYATRSNDGKRPKQQLENRHKLSNDEAKMTEPSHQNGIPKKHE